MTGDDVRAVTFGRPGFGKRGYAPAEVDDFLDRAAAELDARAAGRPGSMGPEDVRQVVFRKPRSASAATPRTRSTTSSTGWRPPSAARPAPARGSS